MATRWQMLTVVSTRRTELLDITDAVARACREGDAGDGLAVVYCPHTTAGVLIQEAEPGLLHGGTLGLGTWQRILFVELDGPRQREVHVGVIA